MSEFVCYGICLLRNLSVGPSESSVKNNPVALPDEQPHTQPKMCDARSAGYFGMRANARKNPEPVHRFGIVCGLVRMDVGHGRRLVRKSELPAKPEYATRNVARKPSLQPGNRAPSLQIPVAAPGSPRRLKPRGPAADLPKQPRLGLLQRPHVALVFGEKHAPRAHAAATRQLQLIPNALGLIGGLDLLNLLCKRVSSLGRLGSRGNLPLKRGNLSVALSQRSTVGLVGSSAAGYATGVRASGRTVATYVHAVSSVATAGHTALYLRLLLLRLRLATARRLLLFALRLRAINLTVHEDPFRRNRINETQGMNVSQRGWGQESHRLGTA